MEFHGLLCRFLLASGGSSGDKRGASHVIKTAESTTAKGRLDRYRSSKVPGPRGESDLARAHQRENSAATMARMIEHRRMMAKTMFEQARKMADEELRSSCLLLAADWQRLADGLEKAEMELAAGS
jgi:hypothetical protein